jgi:hypothetical protein
LIKWSVDGTGQKPDNSNNKRRKNMSELLKKYGVTGIKAKHIKAVRAAGLTPHTIFPKDHATANAEDVDTHFLAKFDGILDTLGIMEKFDEVDAEDVPQFRTDLLQLLFGNGKPGNAAEKNSLPSAEPPQT